MNTKYKINPCKGAISNQRLTGNTGIRSLNDTCYDICNAYGNPVGCNKQCSNMIDDVNIKRGFTKCYPKRPLQPPIWQRPNHYFPNLLNKSGNINESLSKCIQMCSNDNLPNECKNNCITDKDAIINERYNEQTVQKDKSVSNKQIKYKKIKNYKKIKEKNTNIKNEITYKDYEKAHPISFYIGFLSISIILSIIIVTIIKVIFVK
jgi:hypothetical protein